MIGVLDIDLALERDSCGVRAFLSTEPDLSNSLLECTTCAAEFSPASAPGAALNRSAFLSTSLLDSLETSIFGDEGSFSEYRKS